MMKKLLKRASTLALALMLILALSATAFADAAVTFDGEAISFAPGSSYTTTDLFENFKNVMPGDHLEQEITIQNNDKRTDYIVVWMKAVPHDEEKNSPVANTTETAAAMTDFLKQLTLRVYKNDEDTPFYEASPDDPAQLTELFRLASIPGGESISLRVELEVPADLGNDYAWRVGEVDWVFHVENYDNYVPPFFPDDDEELTVKKVWSGDNVKERPDSVTVTLYNGEKAVDSVILNDRNGWTYTWKDLDANGKWQVLEDVVPKDYTPSFRVRGSTVTITNTGTLIQTGQLNWPIWLLGGAGLVLILLGGALMVKKRKHNA